MAAEPLGRRVSVPGRRETIDRAFDRTHRLAPRIDARARRDRPTHRFRRDARTDMLGTWGTEATTFTERGGFLVKLFAGARTSCVGRHVAVRCQMSSFKPRRAGAMAGRRATPIARLASAGTMASRTMRCSSAVASSAGAT